MSAPARPPVPATPRGSPQPSARSGGSASSKPWQGPHKGNHGASQNKSGGRFGARPVQPEATKEGEKPDPVVFAADVARWKIEAKIPTERGPIDREKLQVVIHKGEICQHCHQPKVKETDVVFCYGCGWRSDLHGPRGKMVMS